VSGAFISVVKLLDETLATETVCTTTRSLAK